MKRTTQEEAINAIFNKLEAMSQEEFEQEIGKYKDDPLTKILMYAQKPLGYEFEKVLNDNLWDLYEA